MFHIDKSGALSDYIGIETNPVIASPNDKAIGIVFQGYIELVCLAVLNRIGYEFLKKKKKDDLIIFSNGKRVPFNL